MMSKIQSIFNDKIPFPKLLAEFEQWTEQFEYGSLGYFEFETDKLDDYWIENGSQLADQFAIWLRLGEGSMIGFWRPEHFNDDDILPVVLLGSEGEIEVLGESLEDFLYKWADNGNDFENVYDLSPSDEDDDENECLHHLLLDWLKDNNITRPIVNNPITTEYLQAFFDDWQEKNA